MAAGWTGQRHCQRDGQRAPSCDRSPLLPEGAIASREVNSVFPVLLPEAAATLRDWCFFWDWDTTADQYRWMTAWDTTP